MDIILYSRFPVEIMVSWNLDEVKCLHCGHIGLMFHGHCRKCYGDHKVIIDG